MLTSDSINTLQRYCRKANAEREKVITNMVSPEIEIAEKPSKVTHDPFYKVEQVRLHLPDGTETPFFGNVRQDTGECLKAVSDRYNIIQNETLIGRAEEIFKSKALDFTTRYAVTAGGARMFAEYRFKNVGMKVQKDDIQMRLTVRNSFDGTMKVSLAVGLFRVVCSNGASVMEDGFDLMRKHTSNLDIEFANGAIDTAIERFHSSYDSLDAMSRKNITQQEGHWILNGLVKRKTVADRVANQIREIWDKPNFREDEARTVYNLWNASTEHLTHDVAGARKKIELADRINTDITSVLSTASRRGTIAELMVKELNKNN